MSLFKKDKKWGEIPRFVSVFCVLCFLDVVFVSQLDLYYGILKILV